MAKASRTHGVNRWAAGRRRLPASFVRDLAIVCALSLLLFVTLTEALSFMSIRELGERRVVEIPQGASLIEISSILKAAGVVSDPLKFSFAARALGVAGKLQAGAYEFGPEFSELEVLLSLRYGDVAMRNITVPEGYRASQVAVLVEGRLGIPRDEFMAEVQNPMLVAQLGLAAPSLEGFLHPDSYRFTLAATARGVVDRMLERTWEVYDESMSGRATDIGLSMLEVFTLASIIEAEAAVDSERARISAVYHNRLRKGWKLEADPTVRYAAGKFGDRVYYSDLEIDSPYNTYVHQGLPPGPICNPGTASLRAALRPLEGCEDLFFVANGDGTHTFSRTYAEHEAARRRIAQGRKSGQFALDTAESE